MRLIFTLIFGLIITSLTYCQLDPKIDFTKDLYLDCDSIVIFEYEQISNEKWDSVAIEDDLKELELRSKQILYYTNGTLSLEKNYDCKNDNCEQKSEVEYKVNKSEIVETTSAIVGDLKIPFTEHFNVDYIWVTKIAPIQLLPAEKAGKVLTDESIMTEYEAAMMKIIEGSVIIIENNSGQKVKQFKDVDGKIIREETIVKMEDKIELITKTFLNHETSSTLSYTLNGDIASKKGLNYDYKYNEEGNWVLMKRGRYLLKRTIY